MSKFRKKPVIIEAQELTKDNAEDLAKWCGAKGFWTNHSNNDEVFINIETLEGTITAKEGDFIVKGIKGEFYPCKPDIFEKTYEAVND